LEVAARTGEADIKKRTSFLSLFPGNAEQYIRLNKVRHFMKTQFQLSMGTLIDKHNQSMAEPNAGFSEEDSNTRGYMATNKKNSQDEHHMNDTQSKNSLLKLTP
jgi:hypothetical protein